MVCVRTVIVRKGWTKVEVPDDWSPVIRGNRRARSQQQVRQFGSKKLPTQPPSISRQSVPRSIAGSSRCGATEDSGIPRSAPARRHAEAGFAISAGEGQTTSAGYSCHGGTHCQSESVAESRTRQRSRCAMCPPLEEIEDTSCRSDDADFFFLREVTRLEQMVVELQRQLPMEFSWSHHRVFLWSHLNFSQIRIRKREDCVPATEHEELEWMADRQARNLMEVARMTQPGVCNRNRRFCPWGQLQRRHERSAETGCAVAGG